MYKRQGFLLPDAPLEECELVVRYLDEELNQQAPETLLCLEFVIRYLRDWGETHADAAFQKSSQYAEMVLIVQSQCPVSYTHLDVYKRQR